jgi:hypothetical protein
MKYVTSSRRQIVMAALLVLAVIGAAVRYWAPDPSLARDIGTLLLVLWLPAVGNLVAFLVRRWHPGARSRAGFGAQQAFSPQLVVHITALEGSPGASLAPDLRGCTIAVGHEGFTARTAIPLARVLAEGGAPQDVPLELLRPELALQRLPPGTRFQLLAGQAAVARGTVQRPCP